MKNGARREAKFLGQLDLGKRGFPLFQGRRRYRQMISNFFIDIFDFAASLLPCLADLAYRLGDDD